MLSWYLPWICNNKTFHATCYHYKQIKKPLNDVVDNSIKFIKFLCSVSDWFATWTPSLRRQRLPDKWHLTSWIQNLLKSLQSLRSIRSPRSLRSFRSLLWPKSRWDSSSWPQCKPTLALSLTWVWRYQAMSYLFGAFREQKSNGY